MILDIDSIKHWLALKAQMASVKKQEMELRKQLVSSFAPFVKAGTSHTQVGNIMLTASVSERLTTKREDIMGLLLNDQEKECIKWTPTIDKKQYDQLPQDSQLRTVVTLKLGAPTLKAENLEVS